LAPDTLTGAEPRKATRRPDSQTLLAWYDRHARRLPWRALPGETPNPYRVWLSEIMLQQTTVAAVVPYYARFLARWPTVEALAAASLDDVLKEWAGLGYYARARNLHACAQTVVERHGGVFPAAEAGLRELPGIGAYTAAAVAAIAFGQRAAPVDGNIERVIARICAVTEPLPGAKPLIRELAEQLTPERRAGDFAQAMMDLGATLCTPANPACGICPWFSDCMARRSGLQAELPRKRPKPPPVPRQGAAFWVVRSGTEVLVRTRPAKGLLGGMTEFPGTNWTQGFDPAGAVAHAPPLKLPRSRKAAWDALPGTVSHTFTHFPLQLHVYAAAVLARTPAPDGMRWVALAQLHAEALPSVMRKVAAHAAAHTSMSLQGNARNADRTSRDRSAHEQGGGAR
jgi:A/G-specific adenine glycosylase